MDEEKHVRFQVLTAASMMFRIVFWDVLPCKIVVDRRFRGTYCLHRSTTVLHGSTSQKIILNEERHIRFKYNLNLRSQRPSDQSLLLRPHDHYEKLIFRWILGKQSNRVWTAFICLELVTSDRLL
jgi:hypothetical protein